MNPIRFTLPGRWRGVLFYCESNEELRAWREWLTTLVQSAGSLNGYAVLKYSSSGEVVRAQAPAVAGSQAVVCKLSRALGLWARFARSRARSNAAAAVALLESGIRTARPLALLERSTESWLVSEHLPDLVDLDQLVLTILPKLDARESYAEKQRASQAMVEFFAGLLRLGFHHRDLKASNILFQRRACGTGFQPVGEEVENLTVSTEVEILKLHNGPEGDAGPGVVVLDLDGLRLKTVRDADRLEKDRLTRLAASLLQYRSVTRTDYARFLKAYLGATEREPEHWPSWFTRIARAAAAYNERAQRRKLGKLDGYAG